MNREQDVMHWLSDLPDRYILEADSAGKHKKGGSTMRKLFFAGAGIGAAALVGAAGICTARFWNRSDGPVSPVELERTQEAESQENPSGDIISFETQSMTPTADYEMNMVEYEENRYEFSGWICWYEGLVPCEEQDTFADCLTNAFGGERIPVIGYCIPGNERYLVFEQASCAEMDLESRFFMLYERTDRKDPNTEIPLKKLHAYYGCITEVTAQDVLVQGLETNAVNDRGLISYAKNDIAMISGYVDGQWRSRFEDLQAGDSVCVIQSGEVMETWPGQFSGIAKIIVMDHEDVQTQALSQDTLIAAAAAYAKRIGEKASDSRDLEWMGLSEDVAEHVKEAAPLSGLVPQEAMVLSLSEKVMLSYMEAAGMEMPAAEEGKKQMYHMGVNALGNLLNSRTSEAAVLGAMSALSRQEYLWAEQSAEATCVWLYYGSEVPSVFAAFLPRTDTVTEIDVTPVDPSVYLRISQCVQAGDEKAPDDTGLTEIASIFADVQFCTDLTAVDLSGDSLQGLCAPADDTEGNGEFYQKIVTELIDAVPDDMTELKSLYTSSDQLLEQLDRIHAILREAKNAQEPIKITSWQLPQDNPYVMSQLSASVGSTCGVLQLASSSVMAQLLHMNQPIYTCPRSWPYDVLLYAELPGLVILVSAEAADNGFLAITPNLILTDEPEQIRQLIEEMGLEG